MSFIEIENLSFGYPAEENCEAVNVLKNINLSIKRGEFVAILGHNGCGKSTLSKILNAIFLPTSGKVVVAGIDTRSEKNVYDIRKQVGLVLQNPENQIVAGIVEEDVAFGPENIGLEPFEIRKRVDESLKIVGMYEHRRSSPHKLSGGQKQRIAIAGILAMRPDCIVLDEPTSMLDPSGREEVLLTIKKLNKDLGMTVILITHFMNEALNADRVVVMSNGEILLQGTPKQVFSHTNVLKQNFLDIPQTIQLMESLRSQGIRLPSTVFNEDECISVLSNSMKKVPFYFNETLRTSEKKFLKPKICFENVSFYYGKGTPFEKKALSEIDLCINDGEFVGVIGHTGSGKSTLVQHFNGLFKPFNGKVLFDGKDINRSQKTSKEIKFKVGLVFQYPEHQLFEETIYNDIAFGPKNMNLSNSEINDRVMMAIDFVGLSKDLLNKSPLDISGGEKRKVAIAGVIAMDPDVLILDEPTAGLDPHGRDNLLEKIQAYHRIRKNTIIMVSHSMEDIAKVSNRVIVMDKGKIKMFDDTRTVFSNVKMLEDLGLNVPQITRITSRLRDLGFNLSPGIIDVKTAASQIKRFIDGGRISNV